MKDTKSIIPKSKYGGNDTVYLLFCFFFSIIYAFGQTSVRELKKEEYHLWGKLTVEELSEKGNWVSYTMKYHDSSDTLFIKNIEKNEVHKFIEGTKGKFLNEKAFVCIENGNQLSITNLNTGLKKVFNEVNKFDSVNNDKYILFQMNGENQTKKMILFNIETALAKEWNNVTELNYNNEKNALAYTIAEKNNNQINILFFEKEKEQTLLVENSSSNYSGLTWQSNGTSISFFKDKKKIGYYSLRENRLFEFDTNTEGNLANNHQLYIRGNSSLKISEDGNHVFFEIEQKNTIKDSSDVQIWNTADRWVYPQYNEIKGWQKIPKIAVWNPRQNRYKQLTTNDFPKGFLSQNQKHVITYNPMDYEPQFKYTGSSDIYITNIATGVKELVVEKYPFQEDIIHTSPCGNYIVYFKTGNWFLYSIVNKMHKNLTATIATPFYSESYDMPDNPPACGFAGWTEKNEVLLYDQYDVWKLSLNGLNSLRLTKGREQKITYRLIQQYPENKNRTNFNRFEKGVYNLSKGLLFSIKGEEKKGYASWNDKKGLEILVNKKKRVTQIIKAKKDNSYVYVEEHFNQSPKIMFLNKRLNKEKVLFESNLHQQYFEWGFSKKIAYQSPKGNQLYGALFYPAGYSEDKKYPMIVKIYESLSDSYDQYVNPTAYNSTGFNISNFTSQGFFVLLPDIEYQIGDPGLSATACVVTATETAIKEASIDKTKIGLIGHSFGGYETNFIITQTNLFAAAIAGSGNSDIISSYLYLAKNLGKPNQWRYEDYQGRMGKTLFEDWSGYIRNSPLFQIDKVKTPLLLWTGSEDFHVNYTQSIKFYLAHRRLQNTNILVMYDKEGHVLMNKKNQLDLTQKTEDWFRHYLKDEPKSLWMKPQN